MPAECPDTDGCAASHADTIGSIKAHCSSVVSV